MALNQSSVQYFLTNQTYIQESSGKRIFTVRINWTKNTTELPNNAAIQVQLALQKLSFESTGIVILNRSLDGDFGAFDVSVVDNQPYQELPDNTMAMTTRMIYQGQTISHDLGSQLTIVAAPPLEPQTNWVVMSFSSIEFKDDNLKGTFVAGKTSNFPFEFNNRQLRMIVQVKNSIGQVIDIIPFDFTFGSNNTVTRSIDENYSENNIVVEIFVWDDINRPYTGILSRELENMVTNLPMEQNNAFTISYIDNTSQNYILTQSDAQVIANLPSDIRWAILNSVLVDSPINATASQVVNAINAKLASLPTEEEDKVSDNMISQSVGAFEIKNGRITGEVLYIAELAFNPFWYGKQITSFIQIKNQSGQVVIVKSNKIIFTNSERDERITIDEDTFSETKLNIEFFVFVDETDLRAFAVPKDQFVEEGMQPPPPPPQTNDKLFGALKGIMFGTLALSLLGSKK